MAERPDRICPHLHIPLQSGSDAVLRRMNRRWPAGGSSSDAARFSASLDQPALTTDVIVGFPGETEADFAATCRVVEEVGFAKVHVFRFSPRQGTPAAEMPGQVTNRIVQRRAAELGKLARSCARRISKACRPQGCRCWSKCRLPIGRMDGGHQRPARICRPAWRPRADRPVCRVTGERVECGRLWAEGVKRLPTLPSFAVR